MVLIVTKICLIVFFGGLSGTTYPAFILGDER